MYYFLTAVAVERGEIYGFCLVFGEVVGGEEVSEVFVCFMDGKVGGSA